jgi:hypothetical protein
VQQPSPETIAGLSGSAKPVAVAPRIVSIGPPPQQYADRIVAQMMRHIVLARTRLWTEIHQIIDARSDGNKKGQRKMVARVQQIDGADVFLSIKLTPGKRGRYRLDIIDLRGFDSFKQEILGIDDPIPSKPWLAFALTQITSQGNYRYEEATAALLVVTHHALSRLVQRCAVREATDLLVAVTAILAAYLETFSKQTMPDNFRLTFALPEDMGGRVGSARGAHPGAHNPAAGGDGVMTGKPDASKQFEYVDIFRHVDTFADQGPWCWNCELSFASLDDAPPDCPMHFCNPGCEREWTSQQPLQNFLNKRKHSRRCCNE